MWFPQTCHGNGNAENVMEFHLGSLVYKRPVYIMGKFPIEVCPVVNIFQMSQQKLSVSL